MSLLEWLKFWSKSHRIPLFCSNLIQNTPHQNENCQRVQIQVSQNTPPKMKIVRGSKSEGPRIPPPKSKLPTSFPKSKSKGPRIPPPPNPNFQLLFLSPNPKVPEYPPPHPKSKLPTFFPKSKSEGPRIPPQIQTSNFFPKSKSEVTEYPPPPKN